MLFDLNQTMQYSTPESWIPCDTEVSAPVSFQTQSLVQG